MSVEAMPDRAFNNFFSTSARLRLFVSDSHELGYPVVAKNLANPPLQESI